MQPWQQWFRFDSCFEGGGALQTPEPSYGVCHISDTKLDVLKVGAVHQVPR